MGQLTVALAYTAVIASGNHPSGSVFQQESMRQHSAVCIEEGTISC